MLKVYPESLIYLFGPLVGLADEGMNVDAKLRLPVVSEESVKRTYESELKPHFLALDPRLQSVCKVSLQYVLNALDFNYRHEFNSMLLPFDCPESEPKQGFLWLWEVLFPNEQPVPLVQPFEIDYSGNVAQRILEGA